ncbi:MAG: hypothetical protein LBQ66_06335, partial [Planctomycetaceae bacterium]|nr:hypothetical protein [Planctomycetaceae bacterium]
MIHFFCSILFSRAAATVVVIISGILMVALTWAFGNERIHRKPIVVAWAIFLLFVCLGLFYIRYSYMKETDIQVKIYRDISRHIAWILQQKTALPDSDKVSQYCEYLRTCEKFDDIIFSLYLIKRNENSSEIFQFLNLTTSSSVAGAGGEWRTVPLPQIFGQEEIPKPIADAFAKKIADGIVNRADYRENRFLYTAPLFEPSGDVNSVLCIEITERDWKHELLHARILPHLFFFSFLFFFFAMQIVLIRRRVIVKNLKDNRIISFEQILDNLIIVKKAAEEKSIDRNYLIRQVDSEFKRPLLPILETSFLLRWQLQNVPNRLSNHDFWSANMIMIENVLWRHKKLKRVLNDIRTFIDFEWNEINVETVSFSPQLIVRDIRNICQLHFLENQKIKFQIDTATALPDLVLGDEQKIRRVLEELLELAIDRVSDGHIKITCYMSESQLCWSILDTGEMPTEKVTRQLNDFYGRGLQRQTESDGKSTFNFDFGSSIAVAFTHLLKGSISFQNSTGHGNKCIAMFPV